MKLMGRILYMAAGGLAVSIWQYKKHFAFAFLMGTLAAVMFLQTGCRSRSPKGLHGGTDAERGMAKAALDDAYRFLHGTGHFPNVKPYDGWTLRLNPVGQDHVFPGHPGKTYAVAYGSHAVTFKRPMFGNMMFHEMKHILLERYGYSAESRSHDRRAFPEGDKVKRN